MRWTKILGGAAVVAAAMGMAAGEVQGQDRPLSPRGHTATQLGGSYSAEGRYEGGRWIDIHYGRPILRGRQGIFGAGEGYGQRIYAGAPLWRVGADQTDHLHDGGRPAHRRAAPGRRRVHDVRRPLRARCVGDRLHDLGRQAGSPRRRPEQPVWAPTATDTSRDVMRTTMSVETVDYSMDQLQIGFVDMTSEGGTLYILWDNQLASVPVVLAN